MRRLLLHLGLALLLTLIPATAPPLLGQAAGGTAAALLSAAERRARDGDTQGALTDYQEIVSRFPESPQAPEALLRMAQGQLDAGDRGAALATAEQLVSAYPGAPQAAAALVLEGRVRSATPTAADDLEAARKTLEKTWLLFPRTAYPSLPSRSAAWVLDGDLALRLGQLDEATTSFLEVVEMETISAWSAEAHLGLGMALVGAGEWRAAAESFQRALAVDGAGNETLARARRRLSLLERRLLRPASGARLWSRARAMTLSGTPPKRLTGVATNDRGRLLVVDSGADAVMLISTGGEVEQRWPARDGEKPSWNRDSSAYVVATKDSVLVPGESSKGFPQPGKDRDLDGIRAVERGPFGGWLVAASRQGVLSYAADRSAGRVLVGGDGDPVDLAIDGRDRLYVLERKGRRVVRIDLRSERSETVLRGDWRQAAALAIDPFGYIHVLDGGDGRIHTYDSAGEMLGAIGPLLADGIELRRPEDLAAAGDGRLFVADARLGLIVLE